MKNLVWIAAIALFALPTNHPLSPHIDHGLSVVLAACCGVLLGASEANAKKERPIDKRSHNDLR